MPHHFHVVSYKRSCFVFCMRWAGMDLYDENYYTKESVFDVVWSLIRYKLWYESPFQYIPWYMISNCIRLVWISKWTYHIKTIFMFSGSEYEEIHVSTFPIHLITMISNVSVWRWFEWRSYHLNTYNDLSYMKRHEMSHTHIKVFEFYWVLLKDSSVVSRRRNILNHRGIFICKYPKVKSFNRVHWPLYFWYTDQVPLQVWTWYGRP